MKINGWNISPPPPNKWPPVEGVFESQVLELPIKMHPVFMGERDKRLRGRMLKNMKRLGINYLLVIGWRVLPCNLEPIESHPDFVALLERYGDGYEQKIWPL